MGKIFYIIINLFFCLIIISCAEIERLPESTNSPNSTITEEIWSSAYEILIETTLMPFDNKFSPEQTSTEQVGNPTTKNNNIFLVKQNSFGSRDWIVDLGISDEDSEISMTFDSSENVYITEYTRNGLEGNNNSEDFTVLLVKYNSYGSKEWIKILGNSEVEYGVRLTMDTSDNIYVTGFFSEYELDNKFGPQNTLLSKYNSSGNREWTKILGSTLVDIVWDVTVDSNDNIYITGFSDNSFAQNNSWQEDILMMKFNTDGIKL